MLSLALRYFELLLCLPITSSAQAQRGSLQSQIDRIATDALAKTGVPSASVAVVKSGQIAYLRAYGNVRLEPRTAAKPGSLGLLGAPQDFTQTSQELRGGMTERVYRVKFANKTLRAWTYEMPDGKLEQYQVAVWE